MRLIFRVLCLALLLPSRGGLLKNIDPILSAELLHVLRSMGHGDKLVICDVNFPAAEVATKTITGKHIFLEGGESHTVEASHSRQSFLLRIIIPRIRVCAAHLVQWTCLGLWTRFCPSCRSISL